MTQSAVSQQIKSLESFLGRPLFHRRARRLELTETALTYLPAVREAFTTLRAGTRNLIGFDRDQTLEIQSNLAFSVHWLAPRLPRLMHLHPWIRLNITTALWAPERTAPTADLEIRFGLGGAESRHAERLTRDTAFPVCAPERSFESIEQMLAAPLMDCSGLRTGWRAWLGAAGTELPSTVAINWTTTFVITFAAAEADAAVVMGHDTIADGLVASGRLHRPFDLAVPMEEAYYLIQPDPGPPTPACAAFLGWLESEFSGSTSATVA